MRILGIDPGLAIVGYGIIDKKNNGKIEVVDYGAIVTPKEETLPTRLAIIHENLNELIDKFKPDEVALEELFFTKNITTGIAVAEARGVILLCATQRTGKLFEYTPNQIKQAITGTGRAEKHQVQYMTSKILGLAGIPKPDDAADALAVALTHSQTNQKISSFSIA